MYAIIEDGGKQYRVSPGDRVEIERRDAAEGETLSFERVLMIGGGEGGPVIGRPYVEGATVTAEILGEAKGKKVVIMHFRRRKNSRVKRGHRQKYTTVLVKEINA